MKRIILLFSALLLAILTQAQDKKEIKINNKDGKYELTIEKEVNGEKSVVTKTYDSRDEMMNDPDLEGMNIFVMDSGDRTMKIESKDGEKSYDFKFKSGDDDDGEEMTFDVIVEGLEGEDGHEIKTNNHKVMIFKGEGEEGSFGMHNGFNITKDDDGTIHITKDGEEIEGDIWVDEDGNEFQIKRRDGHVLIINGDGDFEWAGEEDFHFDISTDVEGEGEHKVMMLKSEDGEVKEWTDDEGKTIKIKKIIKEGGEDGEHKIIMLDGNGEEIHDGEHKDVQVFVKKMEDGSESMKVTVKVVEKINLHIEEVGSGEFESLMDAKSKKIKVEDINYYPNPSPGKFNLQFKAPDKPTSIKVLSMEGKEIYSEELNSFEGSYDNKIDLTAQKRGIYLLKIQQGSRTINKKIVIE